MIPEHAHSKASITQGAVWKSISATHRGRSSGSGHVSHFTAFVPRRGMILSKSYFMGFGLGIRDYLDCTVGRCFLVGIDDYLTNRATNKDGTRSWILDTMHRAVDSSMDSAILKG